MDIKQKIEQIVAKVKGEPDFANQFKADPVKAVESVLGIDLPKEQINSLIDGVKAKISVDDLGDALGSIKKKLF